MSPYYERPATNGSLSAGGEFDLELDVDGIGERRYRGDRQIRRRHFDIRSRHARRLMPTPNSGSSVRGVLLGLGAFSIFPVHDAQAKQLVRNFSVWQKP